MFGFVIYWPTLYLLFSPLIWEMLIRGCLSHKLKSVSGLTYFPVRLSDHLFEKLMSHKFFLPIH